MSYLIAKPFVMRTMIDWQHQKRLKQHITHSPKQLSMYIYRAEAGGSPEANCNLIVWIWKMLILYCVLQCFLPSLESVPSVKVSMSARINSEFVRAEK